MKRYIGLLAAAAVLVGCAPSPPRPAASFQGPSGVQDGRLGGPLMPWPRFQASLAPRANEAELAIILRGHELRERHPGATPTELAEKLAHEDVWSRNARFVQAERRTVVIQEALAPW
jgi:hypothetical protein